MMTCRNAVLTTAWVSIVALTACSQPPSESEAPPARAPAAADFGTVAGKAVKLYALANASGAQVA